MSVTQATITYAADHIADWVAVVLLVGGIGTVVWSIRKDRRESDLADNADVAAALSVRDATIEGLKEQNDLLRTQAEELTRQVNAEREAARESAQRQSAREHKLEERIERLESDYRKLVVTITKSSVCVNASTCPTYSAGDRRSTQGPTT